MSDPKIKIKLGGITEIVERKGEVRVDHHDESCARTREVEDAINEGKPVRHPDDPQAARCGPAMVNSDAFREGWDTIFGKKQTVGQA